VPYLNLGNEDRGTNIYIKTDNGQIFSKLKNKDVYLLIASSKCDHPSAIDIWVDLYPFLESYDWKIIFGLSFEITSEPYLQSFQYKIINRILNTREKLHKWKIIDSNTCQYCGKIDTIEHHLYICSHSKAIWKQLET